MAWFTKRKMAGQSRWHILRWPFGNAGRPAGVYRELGKRRSHRMGLHASVFLYGSLKGEPFSECSDTIDVCIHGALVPVTARVFLEQRVLLTNLHTQRDLECRVVRIDKKRNAAALEFIEPCPQFWSIGPRLIPLKADCHSASSILIILCAKRKKASLWLDHCCARPMGVSLCGDSELRIRKLRPITALTHIVTGPYR